MNGKPVYALWGPSAPPAALNGHIVKITDVYGNETITGTPVFMEIVK